ncbi:hypothetical protein BDZ89DRAFT_1170221 [Hymenopellis radicata]|nr:hypothetical protein BDZ89DRAFT_1170221 [Hymenopellis radicata]
METIITVQIGGLLLCLLAALKLLPSKSKGYILENKVVHARLLPVESKHAFVYPTICLLVPLDALERRELDLCGGAVFGYGALWGRLTGLRPTPYLTTLKGTIRRKLEGVLSSHGYEKEDLDDAWMMTMPSFLGFEGINPLTVYFCYKPNGEFWLTVLEVHNTFGENHVYILETGKNEETPSKGFDHQWAFRRAFHVSPFNDRSGFYVVSIIRPTHPPSSAGSSSAPPLPAVRVHLHLDNPADPTLPGPLKLTALLKPVSARPLSTLALLSTLARYPLGLLLAFPRILYNAYILHYKKRLDVFIRPEPKPSWGTTEHVGGVKWLPEGIFDAYARRRNEAFLRQRVEETSMTVRFVAGDPLVPEMVFTPRMSEKKTEELTIRYTAPKFFSILFSAPSAEHALLMGSTSEGFFTVSNEAIFLRVYQPLESSSPMGRRQRLRAHPIPSSISFVIPNQHPLDASGNKLVSYAVLWMMQTMDDVESAIFRLLKARTVHNNEPWYREQWQRAVNAPAMKPVYELGSVRSTV